jgi:hypothetical protein
MRLEVSSRLEMATMEPEEFVAMREHLPLATAQGLMETYRISQNTWYKLRDGLPVKRKTLDQLRERFRAVAGAQAELTG